MNRHCIPGLIIPVGFSAGWVLNDAQAYAHAALHLPTLVPT